MSLRNSIYNEFFFSASKDNSWNHWRPFFQYVFIFGSTVNMKLFCFIYNFSRIRLFCWRSNKRKKNNWRWSTLNIWNIVKLTLILVTRVYVHRRGFAIPANVDVVQSNDSYAIQSYVLHFFGDFFFFSRLYWVPLVHAIVITIIRTE